MNKIIEVDEEDLLPIFYSAEELTDVELKFVGDLSQVRIDVSGKNYHATVPGDLARGLWEFQEELYRAATFALYGVEDIRKLRPEERANFELVFTVSEGSSLFTAPIEKFVEALAAGITNMESKDKLRAIVVVSALLTGGWVLTTQIEGATARESTKADVTKETLRTEQFKAMAQVANNAVVSRFAQASEAGARAIIKGASDADEITIGKAVIGRDAIVEANQRASKEKATSRMIVDEFQIISAEKRGAGFTKFVLANKTYPEFRVNVADDEIEQESMDRLWVAFREFKPVKLEVNATLIREQIRTAHLVRVH